MDIEEANIPSWFQEILGTNSDCIVNVKEWDDEESRSLDGFKGVDFCHSASASVRILKYVMLPNNRGGVHNADCEEKNAPVLVAPVHFTPRAESGRGYCHGGSMCAIMDDAVGWMGFCCTGIVKPWAGYTVQVNTSLKKSVKVGSVLKLIAWVDRLEGSRKVWIGCKLVDPEDESVIHCEGTGLFLHESKK